MKKFLALMALVVCLMLVFVACDNNGDEVSSDEPATEAPATAVCSHEYDNNCDATCNLCGEKREVTHTEVVLEAKSATCTESGLTEGKKCSVCGTITVAQEKIPATGHTEEVIKGVSATCTSTGLTDGKKCSVCGEILVAQTTIMATGHKNVETVAGKDATCTETGLTEGKKCSDCGAWVVEQAIIPEKGHVEVYVGAIEPTCTESGYTGATICVVCEDVLDYGEEIEATGHNPEHVKKIDAKAPTCTEWGWTAGSYCLDCGEIVEGIEDIGLTGHDFKNYKYNNDATCVFDGTETAKCENCDATDTRVKAGTKGHTYGEYKSNGDATCTADGTKTAYCTRCNAEKTIKDEESVLGHDWKSVDAKEANCTEYGWDAYTKCGRCGETNGYNEIPKKGHTEVSIGEAKDPTCTEAGTTAGVKCDVCNAIIEAQKSIPATGHTNKIIEAVAPKCTTTGHTAGVECATCGEILVATRVVEELGHDRDPENRNICKRCGDGCEHDAQLVDIAQVKPTCTENGTVAGVQCPLCKKYQIITKTEEGETITWETALEVIPALDHDYEHHDGKAPTCTEGGYDAYETCGRCDYTTYNAIKELGHKYSYDCQTICERCKDVRKTVVEHDFDDEYCIENCNVCGESNNGKHGVFQYGVCEDCGAKDPAYDGKAMTFYDAYMSDKDYLKGNSIVDAASFDGYVINYSSWSFDYATSSNINGYRYTNGEVIKLSSEATEMDMLLGGWVAFHSDAKVRTFGVFVDKLESDNDIYSYDTTNHPHFDIYNYRGTYGDFAEGDYKSQHDGYHNDIAGKGANARRYLLHLGYPAKMQSNYGGKILWNEVNDGEVHTIYVVALLESGEKIVLQDVKVQTVKEHDCTPNENDCNPKIVSTTCEVAGYTEVRCNLFLCPVKHKINVAESALGHNYSEAYESSNGKHWHKCLNSGCTSRKDVEECYGKDGINCDKCGAKYACQHIWNFSENGTATCQVCKTSLAVPHTYWEGEKLYNNATLSNSTGSNNKITLEGGYATITGGSKTGEDCVFAIPQGPDYTGNKETPYHKRYIVIRYKTNEKLGIKFVTWTTPIVTDGGSLDATGDQWATKVYDVGEDAVASSVIHIRCNIGGTANAKTSFSHFASFDTLDDAQAYADALNTANNCLNGHNIKVLESGTKIACSVCGGVIYSGSNSSYGDSSFLATCPAPNGGTVTNNGSYVTLAGCSSQMQYIDADADRYIVAVYRKGTSAYANFGACYYNTKTSNHQMAFASFTVGSRDWNNQVGATTSTSDNFCIGIIDMKCKANETHSIISFIPDNGGTGSTDLALYATFATQAEAEAFAAALAYVSIT